MAKTKKELNEEVNLNDLDLEVKLEKPELDVKDAIRNYFDESFKKLEDAGNNTSFLSRQQFMAMLEGAFNTL